VQPYMWICFTAGNGKCH